MNIIFNYLSGLFQFLYSYIGDWGLTIMAVTAVVRLAVLPVSMKQKSSIDKQQVLSREMEEVKEKYKNDKEKLDSELAKLSAASAKNMLGCLVTLIQIPVMYTLYRVFSSMPADIASIIVPWVSNIKLPDTSFIIPVISTCIQLMPNLFNALGFYKNLKLPKPAKGQVIITVVMNLFFMTKAPVTIGIYWITSGLFNLLEQTLYNIRIKKKSITPA